MSVVNHWLETLPDDWRLVPLEECMAAIIDYRGKSPKKTSSGIPLVTAKIVKNGRILDDRREYIAPEDYHSWMRRGLPKAGDIVMTTEAPLGEVAQLDSQRVALAQRIITLRGKDGLLDNTYLKFLMQSSFIQEQLHARATGTTVIGIRQSELRKVKLIIPPFPIQRRIAGILGALDDKIEVNRRINRTLEEMAQTLYKHWFVDFGPFQAGEFVDSELGTVPAGWEVTTVEDLMELSYGKGLPKRKRTPGPYPVFGSSGQIDTHEDYLVEAPGIVVGRKGTIGSLSWARDHFWPIDTTYYVVPKREAYSLEFLYHVLASLDLEKRNSDSAVPGLNRNDTYGLQVIVPPDDVLAHFDAIVKPWFKQIEANNRETQVLAETRDYLLPKLLSGEVEVPAAEAVVEGRPAGPEGAGYEQPALL